MPPVNSQLGYQNFLSGKLTADVTNVATDIFIDTIPSVSQGFLVIDPFTPASREVIFFTSKTASKVSVPAVGGRGVNGTPLPHFNGTTYVMSAIAEMFAALQSGAASTDPIRTDTLFDFILSGGVVAQSAGLVGTFANIIFWQSGVRYSGTSIANKTYTINKDTYVDILGNSDGTVTVTYTEVANNAASPALTAGYTRVAIVITNGTAITTVNQGRESDTAPTISSVVITVTDSLGNLICPRDPNRRTLGYRQITSNATGLTGLGQVPGLSVPVIVPAGRKIRVEVFAYAVDNSTATATSYLGIWEGAVGVGTRKGVGSKKESAANSGGGMGVNAEWTPASPNVSINVAFDLTGGTGGVYAGATNPTYVRVDLV